MKGMYEEALEEAKAFFSGLDFAPIAEVMAQGYEKDGYSGAMSLAAETLAAFSKETYISPWVIAYLYAFTGAKEQIIAWLERGYKIKDPNMLYIIEPCFEILRDETRDKDLLRRMNLPELK